MTVIGLRLYAASGESISAKISEEEAERIKKYLSDYAAGTIPEGARLEVSGLHAKAGIQMEEFAAAAFRPNVPAPRYDSYLTFHLVISGGARINGIVSSDSINAFLAEVNKTNGIATIHSGQHEIWVMADDLKAWKAIEGQPEDDDSDDGYRQNYGGGNRGYGGYRGEQNGGYRRGGDRWNGGGRRPHYSENRRGNW